MGGGIEADGISTDSTGLGSTEFVMVSESSLVNGSGVEVACDLDLQKKTTKLVADDFTTDHAEFPEDGSVLEVSSDLCLQQRTLVLVGRSGNGKSATGNSILRRQAFKSKGRASGVTTACELQSTMLPSGQILNVIDTPGLFSLSPSTEFTCREILNCVTLSKEGIDAVLLVFSLRNRLTEEEKSVLFSLKILFGSKIVDYMVVVFTNEDALEDDDETFENYLEDSPDFKEILDACNNRKVLFRNKAKAHESQKDKQVEELLNYVENIATTNGKPYMDDLFQEIRVNQNAFQEKQSGIFKVKGLFMKQDMSDEVEQLRKMMEKVETTLRETQNRLEQQLKEEQAERLIQEKRANEVEKNSNDVVEKLKEDLERAHKMTKQLQEKHCIIL